MCAMEPQQRQVKGSTRSVGKECSMCGDVGFLNQLLRCTSCRQRYQHRYCSSLYPNALADESHWVCDWCLPKHARSSPKPKLDPSSSPHLPNRHLVRDGSGTTATRSFPSALDCLLEVAESTLNRENLQLEESKAPVKKTPGIPPSVKKSSGMQALHRDDGPNTPKAGRSPVMVHKRKRCADLDIPSKPAQAPEIVKHNSNNKLKPNTPTASTTTTPTTKSPRGGILFSPSRAAVGRRYRLLSEVLC